MLDTAPARTFPARRMEKLARIERTHFWFGARRTLVLRRIDRWFPKDGGPVADLGCGTGSLLPDLARAGRRVVGMDGRFDGLVHALREGGGARVAQADLMRVPLRDGSVSGVVLLDVLEHVDDERALSEAGRVLRPGGVLVATVPALPWLWSRRDEDAGHLRRYTRRGLEDLLRRRGFDVLHVSYYQFLLLPLVAAARLAGRGGTRVRDAEDDVSAVPNAILGAVNRIEVALSRFVPWPCGSSLVAVAARRASA